MSGWYESTRAEVVPDRCSVLVARCCLRRQRGSGGSVEQRESVWCTVHRPVSRQPFCCAACEARWSGLKVALATVHVSRQSLCSEPVARSCSLVAVELFASGAAHERQLTRLRPLPY